MKLRAIARRRAAALRATQLTLDGREVPHSQVLAERGPTGTGYTPLQGELCRIIRLQGFVTTTEAGRIVHASRGHCGHRARFPARRSGACCQHCAADGLAALKRLEDRGLLIRLRKFGGWTFA